MGRLISRVVDALLGRVRPGSGLTVFRPGRGDSYGTLGCVVRLGGRRYGLTCEHVVYGAPRRAEVRTYFPVTETTGAVVGPIARTGGLVIGGEPNETDFALIELSGSAWVSGRFPEPVGRLSDRVYSTRELKIRSGTSLSEHVPVQTIGATSGLVKGVASGVFTPIRFRLDPARPEFITLAPICIEITAVPEKDSPHIDFCDEGDSGALVVTNEQNGDKPRPLGLLISKSADGADGGPVMGRGYAVPIQRVLRDAAGGERSAVIET